MRPFLSASLCFLSIHFSTQNEVWLEGKWQSFFFFSSPLLLLRVVISLIAYAWRLEDLVLVLFSGFSSFRHALANARLEPFSSHLLFFMSICLIVLYLFLFSFFSFFFFYSCSHFFYRCGVVAFSQDVSVRVGSFCIHSFAKASGRFLYAHAEFPTWL